MDLKAFAGILNNREYPFQLSTEEQELAKQNGIVIVYGASDDLIEFDGAIRDEGDCYEGSTFFVDDEGLLPNWDNLDHDDEEVVLAYQKRKSAAKHSIKALWNVNGYSWRYETDIPHETFEIVEDKEKYCRGMVFYITELLK
jgi:hypothetical protein